MRNGLSQQYAAADLIDPELTVGNVMVQRPRYKWWNAAAGFQADSGIACASEVVLSCNRSPPPSLQQHENGVLFVQ
jgi:hypothetical protein